MLRHWNSTGVLTAIAFSCCQPGLIVQTPAFAERSHALLPADMTKGERSLLQIKPDYAYGHRLCQLPPPAGIDPKATLHFDMELLQIYPKEDVRLAGRDQDLIKLIKLEADVWESPRPPFEVGVTV